MVGSPSGLHGQNVPVNVANVHFVPERGTAPIPYPLTEVPTVMEKDSNLTCVNLFHVLKGQWLQKLLTKRIAKIAVLMMTKLIS